MRVETGQARAIIPSVLLILGSSCSIAAQNCIAPEDRNDFEFYPSPNSISLTAGDTTPVRWTLRPKRHEVLFDIASTPSDQIIFVATAQERLRVEQLREGLEYSQRRLSPSSELNFSVNIALSENGKSIQVGRHVFTASENPIEIYATINQSFLCDDSFVSSSLLYVNKIDYDE